MTNTTKRTIRQRTEILALLSHWNFAAKKPDRTRALIAVIYRVLSQLLELILFNKPDRRPKGGRQNMMGDSL